MSLQSTLKKLIEFKTISDDQEANTEALSWYARQLKGLPLTIRNYRFDGYPSLTITTKRTKSPKVFLVAHMDVVPGSKTVFTPRLLGDRLYGRGTFDMKFAAAVYLTLLLELGARLNEYDFGVMLTSDEEIGGRNGVRPLLFNEGYACDVAFLPDGGENWKMEQSAKSTSRVSVRSRGKSAHGARPWLGRDANAQLIAYLTRLAKRFDRLKTKDPDKDPYPTLTIATMYGGEAMNQVPEAAEAILDIRIPNGISRQHINALLKSATSSGSHISIQEFRHSGGYAIDTDGTHHRLFRDIVTKIRKRKPGTIDSHGSSDARHFLNADIPTILIRPRGGGQHSEKEWIDTRDLAIYYRCVREFVERVARRS